MANLIVPKKGTHEYVVGIDFGHGETSAAICPIEWDKKAGVRLNTATDIDLNRAAREKVITSSICRVVNKDGELKLFIGKEAFEKVSDNAGIRLCFKHKPETLDGEEESLMIDFMKAVYQRILENWDALTEKNHVVYIARPSGWQDENAKELYRQMALKAGLPLAGLTSESRAAIYYAKNQMGFANEISKGAIVFDLGSSTLDFTYLSNDNKPIDMGYDVGASKIDYAILKDKILSNDEIAEFVNKHPEYHDALLFRARRFKETAYGRDPESRTIETISLASIIPETDISCDEYLDISCNIRVRNLAELNDCIEESVHYISEMRQATLDFKERVIKERKVNGVFMTGGASRMNFIRPMITEVFGLPESKVKIDEDNPSLTISRGIAMLGATDATSYVLSSELKKKMSKYARDPKLIKELTNKISYAITIASWNTISDACKKWVKNGSSTDTDELKEYIKREMDMFKPKVPNIMSSSTEAYLQDGLKDINRKMNEIIRQYDPSKEISVVGQVQINKDGISNAVTQISSVIDEITKETSNLVWRIVFDVIIGFFFGLIGLAVKYLVRYLLGKNVTDTEKRQNKVDKILEKEQETKPEIFNKILLALDGNKKFNENMSKAIVDYYTCMIDRNIEQVIIPIE